MDPLEARLRDFGEAYYEGPTKVTKAEYEKDQSHKKMIKWALILGAGGAVAYFFGKPIMEWLTSRNKRKEAEAMNGMSEPPGGVISDKVWIAEQIHEQLKRQGIFKSRR